MNSHRLVHAGLTLALFASVMSVAEGASKLKPPADVVYTALGDSITWGLFASRTCQPLVPSPVATACPHATSFVAEVARALAESRGSDVRLQNLAISGARLSWLLSAELDKLSRKATVITVFIGINDFSDIAFNGSGTLEQFESQYGLLIRYLTTSFPKARLVLLNVPNVEYLPCCREVVDSADPTWKAGNTFINGFARIVTVVDLVCDASLYSPAMFPPADGIHPSDAGHARIAADVLAALAAPHRPAASCPPYL